MSNGNGNDDVEPRPTALLSVHDKAGLVEFAKGLRERGFRLVSTGGTARTLADAGIDVVPIAELTGQEEMLEGRVKTLHPRIFAGLLARRDLSEHRRELREAGIEPIDLVVVNLYPFEETVADPDHDLQGALEQIDIGGVSLLRAAAKNFPWVTPVVDPGDYPRFLDALDYDALDLPERLGFARRAIAHTAAYEASICNYLNRLSGDRIDLAETPATEPFPENLALTFRKVQSLRYGENPHQAAAFFAAVPEQPGIVGGRQIQGKELSFNNILDLDSAWLLPDVLGSPGVAVIKHGNPCGAAEGETAAEAYRRARATDPMSAFGSIVGFNVPVDEEAAGEITETFVEAVVAPRFLPAALKVLEKKPNLRVIELDPPGDALESILELRHVSGGLLAQDRDQAAAGEWRCVTERAPTGEETGALRFAWAVVSFVRSNAIVVARSGQLLGIGAGQMSRVDACRFATWKAGDAGHELQGTAAASDAFFPFPDGLEVLADAGVTAVVQPGGSIRDQEVIDAANERDVAMIFTGARHFRH